MSKKNFQFILFLIVAVAAMRLLPHPWNITPVGALGLFAGAYLPSRLSWLVPVAALLVGDALLGFYGFTVMLYVYGGFAVSAVIGRALLHSQRTGGRIAGSVFLSALVFFIVSNFGVWLGGYYAHTLEGLIACYVNAIPFFGRSLFGDMLYSLMLFGSYELFNRFVTERKAHFA